ncbi:11207_t:CDS:2 [Gigaspora margarita]|uniref:11207_t:CDS:1 n=1 Tax=Gigaspora margarita TaxID=4874 RepID=A0ABN7USF6_GIGMA|nr:11207_t:CDS:2 [Gigaspora margarita]
MNSPGHRANILNRDFKEVSSTKNGSKQFIQGGKSSAHSVSSTKNGSKQSFQEHSHSTNNFFHTDSSFKKFVDTTEDTPKKMGHVRVVHKNSKKRRLNYD